MSGNNGASALKVNLFELVCGHKKQEGFWGHALPVKCRFSVPQCAISGYSGKNFCTFTDAAGIFQSDSLRDHSLPPSALL